MGNASEVELRSAPGATTACKRCGEPIAWGKTMRGASIPVDAGAPIQSGETSFFVSSDHVHFATCKAQQGKPKKPDRRTDYEKRLERQVDNLRAELAESAPRDAVTYAVERQRAIEQKLHDVAAELRERTPPRRDAMAKLADGLVDWLHEFRTRGTRPYDGAGRHTGD